MPGRERSPNYPAVSIEKAVKDAQALYKRESRTAVPQEVAVKAWGYKGLSGTSRSRLGALRQYGLIEIEKSGSVRISTRGMTLSLRSPDTPEYKTALAEAALTPPVFRDLRETREGASDEALLHYLVVEKKFSQEGARRVIEVYRANTNFADAGEDASSTGELMPESNSTSPDGGYTVIPQPAAPSAPEQNRGTAATLIAGSPGAPQIHFNIQVHLPESGSPENYDAIFKSIATHLLGRSNDTSA